MFPHLQRRLVVIFVLALLLTFALSWQLQASSLSANGLLSPISPISPIRWLRYMPYVVVAPEATPMP